MLLEFFIIFISISFILILLGKIVDITLGLTGSIILLLLGIALIGSPLTFHTSTIETTTYTYSGTNITETTTTTTPVLTETNYSVGTTILNYTFSSILLLTGFASFFIYIFSRPKQEKEL